MINKHHLASSKLATSGVALTLGALILSGRGSNSSEINSSATSSTSASASASAAATSSTSSEGTAATIADTTSAAEEFMALLSDSEKDSLLYDYTDETKSTVWSNFPVSFVQRNGLNLNDLTEEQQTAAYKVLEGLLNDEAYEMVVNITNGDKHLLEASKSARETLSLTLPALPATPVTSALVMELQPLSSLMIRKNFYLN